MKYQLFEFQDETVFLFECEVDLPSKMVVCDRCQGKGTHTNPNIDGNGISPEEFAEDPDFERDYFNGVYDVRCSVCDGRNVVEVIDESRIPNEYKKQYEATEKALDEMRREDAEYARLRSMGIEY